MEDQRTRRMRVKVTVKNRTSSSGSPHCFARSLRISAARNQINHRELTEYPAENQRMPTSLPYSLFNNS